MDTELTWEEQQEINNHELNKRVKGVVDSLFNELNKMGNEEKVGEYFIEALRCQHRTLQQNFFGHIVLPVIRDFSKRCDEKQYDMRNEASCSVAKKIEPVIKDDIRLPFI